MSIYYFLGEFLKACVVLVLIILPVYFYKKRLRLMDSGHLKKLLFSFKGRATRLEFWTLSVVGYAYGVIVFLLLLALLEGTAQGIFWLVSLVFFFFFLWVESAITVKRWHDRDKSGWWILIHFIPTIGFVWSLWDNGFLRGTEGNNRFGEDPLEISINNKEEITASEESSSEETTSDKEEITASEEVSSGETTSDKEEITASEEVSSGETTSEKEEITSNEEAISDNDKDSPEDKLAKLSELKEKGLIDEEDYNSKKEEILKTI